MPETDSPEPPTPTGSPAPGESPAASWSEALKPAPTAVRGASTRLSPRDLARITVFIVVLIFSALGFLGYRSLLGFKASHDVLIARENLHALHKAFFSYAQDWDQRLPPADNWTDQIAGHLSGSGRAGGAEAALHGPGDGPTIGYVYNDLASGQTLDISEEGAVVQSRLILLIERPGAGPNEHVTIPLQGNPDAELALYRQLQFPHGSDNTETASTVITYANGSQKVLTRQYFKNLLKSAPSGTPR